MRIMADFSRLTQTKKIFAVYIRITCVVGLLSLSVFAQRTNIIVTNGSGDGKYRGQGLTHVWADPPPTGMVFDKWAGDTVLMQDPLEYHSKVNNLSLDINLNATYKPAPEWEPVYETINGSLMASYFPPSPVGLVFHFHGSGGNAIGLFNITEQRPFADQAVADGYAVVTLTSVNRVDAQWNPASQVANNPDMQNVQAAIALFISRGWITAETPVLASGISNGGMFAARVSSALNMRAASIFIAPGPANTMAQTTIPTIWSLAQNDSTIGPDGNANGFLNYQNLISRGISAEFNMNRPSPVYPERFWRIPGLSKTDSQTIQAALKQNGILDGRDYLIANPRDQAWQTAIPPQYKSSVTEIGNQLAICYSEHNFYSDNNRQVLNFFNAHLMK
jgi:predicted esterase